VSLTVLISPAGPHAATSTRWFAGVDSTAVRMRAATSGLPCFTSRPRSVVVVVL
jgi:hypothetical protein